MSNINLRPTLPSVMIALVFFLALKIIIFMMLIFDQQMNEGKVISLWYEFSPRMAFQTKNFMTFKRAF